MKRILDRFDNSPLWIRLVTVLSLSFILVAGLYTVKKNTAAQVTTEIQPAKKTGSLPVKKETKRKEERREGRKDKYRSCLKKQSFKRKQLQARDSCGTLPKLL